MRFLILAILLLPIVSAQYYADVRIDIADDGAATIAGISNHPLLKEGSTYEFTSKSKERWLFNLTTEDTVDAYVFTIVLPEGAALNYVSSRNVNILTEDGRVVLKVVGTDDPIDIAAQYTVEQKQSSFAWLPLAGAMLALALVAILLRKRPQKKPVVVQSAVTKSPTFVEGLPSRQQEIIILLERAGGKLTQKQIEDAMHIPKSSVSRNIDALEKRGLIEKSSYGMSNTISLKK